MKGLDRKRREDAAERARLRRSEAADLRRQAEALEASAAILERTWGLGEIAGETLDIEAGDAKMESYSK